MSYQRLSKPRFYMDNCNWVASRGVSRNSIININSGAGSMPLNSGYTKYQMIDMSPRNYASFDTTSESDTISIRIDCGYGLTQNFVAIMGHNLKTAEGKIRVAYHPSAAITTVGGGTAVSLTEVLNGDVSGDYATPDTDNDTILTFSDNASRYWVVEIDVTAVGAYTADVEIGQIVFGEYYTANVSPDLNVTKATILDDVTVRESAGGRRFASAGWLQGGTTEYSPFRSDTYVRQPSGREAIDFSFSYMDDTDIYPADRSNADDSTNFLDEVVSKCSMNMIPFIFSLDSTSTVEGDFMYGRFSQNSFATLRQAYQVDSFSLRVEQEF